MTVAKAYRLLKAVFNTAVDDGLIRRNPCRIKGAGQERSPERPVLTVPEVYALADAVGARYRALVLLGVFGSLRWGELAALRRSDIEIQARTVRISRRLSEQRGGDFAFGPPKSHAGQRPSGRKRSDCWAGPGDILVEPVRALPLSRNRRANPPAPGQMPAGRTMRPSTRVRWRAGRVEE